MNVVYTERLYTATLFYMKCSIIYRLFNLLSTYHFLLFTHVINNNSLKSQGDYFLFGYNSFNSFTVRKKNTIRKFSLKTQWGNQPLEHLDQGLRLSKGRYDETSLVKMPLERSIQKVASWVPCALT